MKTYQTSGGKQITLFICPKTAHIKAQFVPGGELPQELAGLWTSEREADISIIKYLDKTKDKKKSLE
jgi:hypothetical protein